MNIQFSGLATGIDSAALIDGLVGVKRIPIIRLQNRQVRLQQRLSSFSTLLNRLNELEASAAGLKDQTGINSTSTTVSEDDYFTASSDGRASAGVYSIKVSQLAQREKEVSNINGEGFADVNTTVIGTGTLHLTVGGETTDIEITDGTLGGIKDAIAASGAEVDVTILNDGQTNPFRLVLTGKESGDANTIELDETDFSGTLGLTNQQAAKSANLTIDGIAIIRDSNVVSDAIEGVTLNLTDEDLSGSEVRRLTVEVDTEGIKANVQEFVDKYNSVISFLKDQQTFDAASSSVGRLLGDFTASSVQRTLQSSAGGSISGATGTFSSLGQIGIRTGSDGTLSIDSEDFANAVEADLQGVLSLFDENEGNLTGSIEDYLKSATASRTGLIPGRQKSIQSQIDGLQDRVDDAERSIDQFRQRQVRKYAALERLVGGLQSQSLFLSAQF